MSEALPRWIAVGSGAITLFVGMLGTAATFNGFLVYDQPDALRDGQYMMVFGIGAAAGFWGALPAALLSMVLVFRQPGFFRLHALMLGGIGAFVIGVGVVMAGLGAGWEGVLGALIGLSLSPLGIAIAPLMLLDTEIYGVVALTSLALVLTVLLTYGAYRRSQRAA